MKYNPKTQEIYCFGCKKYLDMFTQTYSDGGQRKCFNDHILGYDRDKDIEHIIFNHHLIREDNKERR